MTSRGAFLCADKHYAISMKGEGESKGRPLAVWGSVAASVLPIAYCMSIGPVVWLQGHGLIRPELTRLIFAPLLWLCDQVGPLNQLANWYIDLWRPL